MQQKTVFITGASSGIGRSCAHLFAAAGARLILCAPRIEPVLQALAAELKEKHGTASHVFRLDVRERDAVAQAIAAFPAEWAAMDVLLNNAGLHRDLSKLYEGSIQDWDAMIDTNVKGLLYAGRAALAWHGGSQSRTHHQHRLAGGHLDVSGRNVYCATQGGGARAHWKA